ncbi:MAG: hypothetical protein ABJE95_22765 [Byssovorax sp.]
MGSLHRLLALAAPLALALQPACTPPAAPPLAAKVASPAVAASSAAPESLLVAGDSGTVSTTDEIIVGIQKLETLVAVRPAVESEQPALLRRLAEAYVDLESTALRDQLDRETRTGSARVHNPSEVAARSAEAERSARIVAAARKNAIKNYEALATRYPTYCAAADLHCGDEVLYFLAYEHQQSKHDDDARRVYLDLIKRFPQSKYVPDAYLAFAEWLFLEAQSDPARLVLAEQAYRKAAELPPPGNRIWGYAHYKLAYVYWSQGDMPRALAEIKQVIEFAAKFPALPNAERLGVTARKDLVPIFALAGDPLKAFAFFKTLSGDPAGETRGALAMSVELGQSYLDTGHYGECVALDLDLLQRAPGEATCKLIAQLDRAIPGVGQAGATAVKAALEKHKKLVAAARAGCGGPVDEGRPGAIHKCAPTDPCSGL